MGNFAFIITFLSEFAVLAQNEGTGIFATFVAMYLIRYGLSTFFFRLSVHFYRQTVL